MKLETIKNDIVVIFEEYGFNIVDDEIIFEDIESLLFVSIVVSIEEHFNIRIPDNYIEIESIFSLNSIINIVFEEISRIEGVGIWTNMM